MRTICSSQLAHTNCPQDTNADAHMLILYPRNVLCQIEPLTFEPLSTGTSQHCRLKSDSISR